MACRDARRRRRGRSCRGAPREAARDPGGAGPDGSDTAKSPLFADDELLTEAQKVGGHRTKKDTVNEALKEYIQRRRQAKITDLFGTIEFEPAYDYKKQRRRP